MTPESTTALCTESDLAAAIADEYVALADLLEAADPVVWDAPSLCEGWRTREVVAHMTMPARYSGPEFMAELEAAGGDFTRLSDTIAARDGALPVGDAAVRAPLRGAARLAAARRRYGGGADALHHPRARHHGGRPAGAAGARPAHRRECWRSSPARVRPPSSAWTSPKCSCRPTTWTGRSGPAHSSRVRRRRWPWRRVAGSCRRVGCAVMAPGASHEDQPGTDSQRPSARALPLQLHDTLMSDVVTSLVMPGGWWQRKRDARARGWDDPSPDLSR